MRKIIYFTGLLCFFVTTTVTAQDVQGQHEIRFGFSDASPITITDALLQGLSSAFSSSTSGYTKETLNKKNRGMWGLGYRYHVSHRFSIGADVGLLSSSKDIEFTKTDDSYTVHRKTTFLLFMPTGQLNYLNREKIQLYGNLGAGVLSYSVKENKDDGSEFNDKFTGFAFQLNPVGVRVGKQFAGFAEIGFGFKGIVNIGASVKF